MFFSFIEIKNGARAVLAGWVEAINSSIFSQLKRTIVTDYGRLMP